MKGLLLKRSNAPNSSKHSEAPGTPFHGLSVEYLHWATGPRMDLVVNHVLETLVVGWAEKYLGVHLSTSVAIVQHLQT